MIPIIAQPPPMQALVSETEFTLAHPSAPIGTRFLVTSSVNPRRTIVAEVVIRGSIRLSPAGQRHLGNPASFVLVPFD